MANEKRLIDANALKKKGFYDLGAEEAIIYVEDIDDAPTVDAVEVVRCYDCKHYGSISGVCYVDRKLGQTIPPVRVKHSDFCSYGERRTNERTD